MSSSARRYNKGKIRHELLPANALSRVAEVYTKGAHKYTIYKNEQGEKVLGKDIPIEEVGRYEIMEDGSNNWRKGQSWTDALGSIKRHITAFELGEDVDPELQTLHLGNAAWGILQLIEYYKIFPQGDDRQHSYLRTPKIGLDIDEVLCNFVEGWHKKWGADPCPEWWTYHRGMDKYFEHMKTDKTIDDFYLSLKPKIKPSDIPFEPYCYVTSRPVDTSVTERWLDIHGFPAVKVYTVGIGASKVEVLKNAGVEIFVDDNFNNFKELNNAGICTFLMDANHNKRYNVGYKRIKSLSELTF